MLPAGDELGDRPVERHLDGVGEPFSVTGPVERSSLSSGGGGVGVRDLRGSAGDVGVLAHDLSGADDVEQYPTAPKAHAGR